MTTEISPTAMGQWKNAPLVFVLAQVRFLAAAGSSAEHVRDAVGKRKAGRRFTAIKPHTTMSLNVDLSSQPPGASPVQLATGYDMSCESYDTMLRVTKDSLSYATTAYKDSTTFLSEWTDLLGALGDLGVQTATRLGMRYVDFVFPAHGKQPEDYVNPPWNLAAMPTLPGTQGQPDMHVHVLDIPYANGRMRLQFMRGVGVPQLAADLQGMLPPLMLPSSRGDAACGVIDSDRWIDTNMSTDTETLAKGFAEIRRDLLQAFQAMITPGARAEWDPHTT